jgi:hypothetical protein
VTRAHVSRAADQDFGTKHSPANAHWPGTRNRSHRTTDQIMTITRSTAAVCVATELDNLGSSYRGPNY